jgi:hypothetical protein
MMEIDLFPKIESKTDHREDSKIGARERTLPLASK